MPAAGRRVGAGRVEVTIADLTAFRADAIVNAANENLQHGGGVAAAILRKGGGVIQIESDRIGHCPTGSAVATTAGALPVRWVVHAVGPLGADPDRARLLASAVRSALAVADGLGCATVALPAIGTGIFGYPLGEAARVIADAAVEFLDGAPAAVRRVVVCAWDDAAYEAFRGALVERA